MYWLLFCLTGSHNNKQKCSTDTHRVCGVCVCVCVCVLDREGNSVFTSRVLVVVSIDGSVCDWLQ